MANGDVLQIVAGHQAFAPGGGGAISATDGTTTVDPMTSLSFPAGTLTDLGSGAAGLILISSVLGPFPFTKDSVLDVGGSYHTLTTLDEGVIVTRAWVIFSETFSKAVVAVDVGVAIGNAAGSIAADVVKYPFTTSGYSVESALFTNAVFDSEPVIDPVTDIVIGPMFVTKVGAVLTAYTSDLPCDTGACQVYAIIATPAS